MNVQDRIKLFDPKYRQNANNSQPPRNPYVPKRPSNQIKSVQNINNKKLLPKSKYISKENDLLIYQYPIIKFNDYEQVYCRNILILGTNELPFIENFINFCSKISYEDDIRYKSPSIKENYMKPFSIYNIKLENNIRIICFPEFNSKNDNFKDKKTFLTLLRIFEQITTRIDFVLFLYNDKLLELNECEKICLFILFNLFGESLKKNIIFLFDTKSNESSNINKEKVLNCIFSNNNNDNEHSFVNQLNFLKNCEFITMNNKIIFESNKGIIKNDWDNLMNNNKYILFKITSPYRNYVLEKRKNLFSDIFNFGESKMKNIVKELFTYLKEELSYWIDFLINVKKIFEIDISPILLQLYNEFYKVNDKVINIKDDNISFINVENIDEVVYLLSNINYFNLKEILFKNCGINNKHLNILGIIFGNNLVNLNLSNNNISVINIFNNKTYPNLIYLDLSNNNISDISLLFNSKMIKLKKLNLSHNIINELKDIEKNNFELIEYLDLSYNKIVDINILAKTKFENILELFLSFNEIKDCDVFSIMSLKTLNKLYLSNNRIEKIDINKLLENLGYNCSKLLLKIEKDDVDENNYDLSFNYSNEKNIKFNYLIKISEINNFLNNLCFKNIQDLTLEGINCLELLENKSLKELKLLDIKMKDIEDLSIFDKIHFLDIKEINLGSNKIKKGLNSLNIFKAIKTKKIKIDKNDSKTFYSKIELENPKIDINLIIDDLEFLNYNIINGIESISISNCNIDKLEYLNSQNFQNLKTIELKNNYLENKETLLSLHSFSKQKNSNNIIINSIDNNLNPNLIKDLFEDFFKMESCYSLYSDNLIKVEYISPIKFSVLINYNKLIDIPTFNKCKKIQINNTNLNNINFLDNKNLISLKEMNLDSNKLENLNEINKILTNNINEEINISIRNNNIYQGLYELDNNLNKKNKKINNIKVQLDENKEKHKITVFYNKLIFDYYININNSLDILKKINLENIKYLDLANIELKNIDFLSNTSLKNLKELNLDNNKIEDISLLKKENIVFNDIQIFEIINNHITQGIEILKNEFVTKCLCMYIDISSLEEKHKVSIFFEDPIYSFEIYINEINDLKAIIENYKNPIKFIPFKGLENKIEKLLPPEKILANGCVAENSYDEINIIINNTRNYTKRNPYISINSNEEENSPIIIDNGSDYIKAGLSGEKDPRVVFPSCVGYPKYFSKKEFFVGNDAEDRKRNLRLKFPIEYGVVEYFGDMEKIWEHIFTNELRVAPEEHNVMLTEVSMNPKRYRESMAQIMFETFRVPGLYIANQAVLALYSAGKCTGMVVDSGDAVTQIVPVFDGFSLPHAIGKLYFGGRDLTKYMQQLLDVTGQSLTVTASKEITKAIKEKSCYVALDFEDELKSVEDFDYRLPDDKHVIVRDQRIKCPEAFFRPSLIGKEGLGISNYCNFLIQKCDIDIRKDLYNCIVLSGGNTMFKGLPERLTKEIKYFAPDSMKEEIKVIASPERKFAVWNGGSILSQISTFESSWITKTEYEESGTTIVHNKCF